MTIAAMLVAVSLAIQNMLPVDSAANSLNKTQTLCLTEAIYHEARGEPEKGRLLVAQTIVNRAERSHKGDLCATLAVKGQFPWWKQRRRMPVTEVDAFNLAAALAVKVQLGLMAPTPMRVYYFFGTTEWRYFRWANTANNIRIGRHIFLPLQSSNDKF